MATPTTSQRVESPEPKKSPWWMAKIWLGAGLRAWQRMAVPNHFAIRPACWHEAFSYLFAGPINSGLGLLERAIYARQMARTGTPAEPIFILGHWRTGTTYLHELLIRDVRHTFPSNYSCFAPHHFLLTEWIARRWFGFAMPAQRAMDNMPLGFERPQEDEFALCNLGVPSPYMTIAFPGRPNQYAEYFDLQDISPAEREHWKRDFLRFTKRLTIREPKRLVLKSPQHTCRVDTLLEVFPDARFIHIVRDPYVVFPSTVHLWKSLFATQGLQKPNLTFIEGFVFETFLKMHRRLDTARALIRPGRFHELRYEDLVANPVSEIEQIYEKLGLDDFESARGEVERYITGVKEYKTNRYRLDTRLRDEITDRWGEQIRRHGYVVEPKGPGASLGSDSDVPDPGVTISSRDALSDNR